MIKRNIVRFVSLWVLGLVGFIAWRLYFELPLGAAELPGGALTQCLLAVLAMACFALGERIASKARLDQS